MYGRTSQRICNYDLTNQISSKTCANIEQSKFQTKQRCHRKSTCQILIDNTIYIDPCGSNILKHFEIHYRCINFNEICLQLFHNCSLLKDLKCIEKIQDDYSCQCPSTICEYNHKRQLIGFIENICSAEIFQGIYWPKTLANKGQHMSCPYPCTGQIFRFCHMNNQWSKPNYTNCQCPIKKFDQLSMHNLAHSYVFQCNFWLINRFLPKDNQCIFETDEHNNDDGSATCLLNAFKKMSFTSCLSFSIDFKNLGFEIFLPNNNNQRKFYLPRISNEIKTQFGSNQILINKIYNSYENLPMMFIDTKNSTSTIKSLILVEQSYNLTSIQTANVTVIFNHQSSELRYQCRAYRSTNSSFQIDTSDIFFTCQLLCSNGSHVICQCPFYNPFMHYILQVDTSISEDNFELLMIDNDLKDKCLIDSFNRSIQQSLNKIDYYLKKFSSYQQKKLLAKKFISFIDTLIDNENEWLTKNFYLKWNLTIQFIQQLDFISLQLINITNSFISINKYIEFFINSQEFENKNQSIRISIDRKINLTFFIISKLDEYLYINQSSNKLNSHLVNLNIKQNNIENIQITFRHLNLLNNSNQISTCVYLKNMTNTSDIQWSTDGCYLLSSNLTHSICSCNHSSTFAVLINVRHIFEKSIINIHMNRLSVISKIGCVTSIICLLLTIIILVMRRRMDMNDDLIIVRNILHINMSICLLIAQLLYLFGINQIKYKFGCQIIIILLHYFLLATYSWMFIDGIELIIALKHTLKIDRIRILAYSLYAYGFPLLIVILSLVLSTHEYYSNKHCWYSYDNAFIWAFAIPFVLFILANICFFIISIYTICKHHKTSDSSKEIKLSLRDITILSILFGLTWLVGLFHLHEQNRIILSYVFTILNSFQGLFIFIFICLLKNQIQNFYIPQILNIYKKSNIEEKSNQHYNTSSSGYSSAHSSDLNKQILSLDHQSSFRTNAEYLSSMPIGLLSTFRYQTSNITLPITLEQNEQLLKKYKIDLHHPHDDHQYYEIG
ncbi:unnamed protein product [Rotaria sp. Silwood1]|nr:unnamed protein product [Rotaria sp. Silwood1]